MKFLFCLISSLLCSIAYTQTYNYPFLNLPLRDEMIHENPSYLRCGSGKSRDGYGAIIRSKNDTCFSITNGIVISYLDLGGELAVVVRAEDQNYYTYAHFKKILVHKGDTLKRSEILGLILKGEAENSFYELLFLMNDNRGRVGTYKEHLNFIRLHGTECTQGPSIAF